MFKIKIQWGEAKFPEDLETYEFSTQAELDAFLKGVDEGCGWHEWEIINQETTTTYSMQKAKEAFENGLTVSVAHPDEPDAPINSLEELEGASGHLFVIEQTQRDRGD